MTATAVDKNTPYREGGLTEYGVKVSQQIYKGTFVVVNRANGFAYDGVDTANYACVGIAKNNVLGATTDGLKRVLVADKGEFQVLGVSLAADDVGKIAYLVDNQTIQTDPTLTANIPVGIVKRYISSTSCIIEFFPTDQMPKLRAVFGKGAFTTTGTSVAVSTQGLAVVLHGSVTPVLDAGAAAANGQLGFTEDGSTGLPEVTAGAVAINRVAGTDSGLKFTYMFWGY